MRVDRFALLLVPALLLLAATAGPVADAHAGPHGYQATRLVDNLLVTFELDGNLPMAGVEMRVFVGVTRADWDPDAGVEGVDVAFTGPGGAALNVTPEGAGAYKAATVTFPGPGDWVANVTVHPHDTSVEYQFRVYPGGPYVWDSPNAATGIWVVGEPTDVQFRLLEWRTGERASAPHDAKARLERWTDDHETLLGEAVVDLEAVGPGLLVLRHAFTEPGMYHVFLASEELGWAFDDRPYEHVFAFTREDALEMGWQPAADISGPGVLAALLAGVAAAAVGAGRAHSRRR